MTLAECEGRTPRAEQRRQHILDTARRLFIDQGFHQASMARIAEVSGVKVGQIYRDFANKEEIIAAICEGDLVTWLDEDALASALATRDPAALRNWLYRFSASIPPDDQGRLMIEILAEAGRNPHIARIMSGIGDRVDGNIAAALAALTSSDDQRRRLEDVAKIVSAIRIGAMFHRLLRPSIDADDLFDYAGDLMKRTLDGAPDTAPPTGRPLKP